MPGSKPRALQKARTLAADVLILDLEDAVVPGEKAAARDHVAAEVAAGGYGGREIVIRINGLDTPWGRDDLAMAAVSGADAVLLPKVENGAMISDLETALTGAGAPPTMTIWAMIETPMGVLNVPEIAGASARLAAQVMGTNDLVKEIGARHTPTREPVVTALSRCILAARAFGSAILDGVYNAYQDEDGLRAEAVQGRDLGFDGKTLIHPAQIAVANAVFAPSPEDLALAERYVAAYAAAEAGGQGVAVVDGRIVENLHVATARRDLAMARMIRALEEDALQ